MATPTRTPLLRRVQSVLRTHRLRSDHDVVRLVENRLSLDAIDGLRRSGLTDEEIYSLILPRRRLTHRRTRGEALSRDESDRALRLARALALAEQVFGNPVRAWRWLRGPKRQLESRSPLQLLATGAGARIVEELLYRSTTGWQRSWQLRLTGPVIRGRLMGHAAHSC